MVCILDWFVFNLTDDTHSLKATPSTQRRSVASRTRWGLHKCQTADNRCPYSDLLWCQHAYRSKRWRQQLWIGTCVTSRPQQTAKKCCMLLSYPSRGRNKTCTDWKAVCSLGMWNVLKVSVWPGQPFTLTKSHSLVTLFNVNDIDAVPLHCQWLLLRMTPFNAKAEDVPDKQLVVADRLSKTHLQCFTLK